ncbi:MAG: hypothetical protein V4801_01230, partial [Burkholderia gladioli]
YFYKIYCRAAVRVLGAGAAVFLRACVCHVCHVCRTRAIHPCRAPHRRTHVRRTRTPIPVPSY